MTEPIPSVNFDRVELKGWEERANYYWGVVVLAGPPAVLALLTVWHGPPANDPTLFVGTLGTAAALLFWWLRVALRYRRVQTKHDADTNYHSVLALAERRGWGVVHIYPARFLELLVPRFATQQRVSVLFRGQDVYVNSIDGPHRRPVITTWYGNGENMVEVMWAVGERWPGT